MRTIAIFLAGAFAATATTLACSDDSPPDADAAECDCPAGEPPLAGRLMKVRGLDSSLPADSPGGASADCPDGATLISGGCILVEDGGGPPQARLMSSGADAVRPTAWACAWRSGPGFAATVHAEALCLLPAQ